MGFTLLDPSYGLGVKPPPSRTARNGAIDPAYRDAEAPCQLSEIRLVRARHRGISSRVSRIFGADIFTSASSAPIAYRRAPISYGRRPRRRKDAFILDGELQLQVPAPIVGVAVGDERNR